MTTSRWRGISTSMFFRLWTRAPRTAIHSCAMAPLSGARESPRTSDPSMGLGGPMLSCARGGRPQSPKRSMRDQLFRTKSLDAILSEGAAPDHQLRRSLGAFDVFMLGVG